MSNKKVQVFTDKQYRLTQSVSPLSFMIPTKNSKRFPLMYFDDESGVNRALRYASNQKSPYEDEQDGNAILAPVIFEDGFLHVQKQNQVLQQFLSLHPLNGVKFCEVNEAKDAETQVDELMIEADAIVEARKLFTDLSQLETISRVLFNKDSSKVSTAELKRDIMVYAKNQPSSFLEVLSDPELKLMATVKQFFDMGLISYRKNKTEVWYSTASNKSKMMNTPFGQDPLDLVVSFFKSNDGLDMLDHLETLLK